jgi:nucleoside-triphosphatase
MRDTVADMATPSPPPALGYRPVVRVLLEWRPGVGKTTVARRLLRDLKHDGVAVAGFTTEELGEAGRRVGFAVETTDGGRAVLAHVDL